MSVARGTREIASPLVARARLCKFRAISCFGNNFLWSRPKSRTLEISLLRAVVVAGNLRTGCLNAINADCTNVFLRAFALQVWKAADAFDSNSNSWSTLNRLHNLCLKNRT